MDVFYNLIFLQGKSRNIYTAEDHQRDVKTRSRFLSRRSCVITPVTNPPDPWEVRKCLECRTSSNATSNKGLKEPRVEDSTHGDVSMLDGPSLDNSYGFKVTPTREIDQCLDSQVGRNIA